MSIEKNWVHIIMVNQIDEEGFAKQMYELLHSGLVWKS